MPPKKATQQQYTKLLHLAEESAVIKWGKGTSEMKKEAWEHVSKVVNSVGGAEKSGEGWKKAFIEWKSHIKGKIRSDKTLSDSEKKCANITGLFTSCTGINIPELGCRKELELYEVNENGTLNKIAAETPEGESPEAESDFLEVSDIAETLHDASSEVHKIGEFGLDDNISSHEDDNLNKRAKKKKIIPSKAKVPCTSLQSTKVLLDKHIKTTNDGLHEIATSILAVADSINNLASAIRDKRTK